MGLRERRSHFGCLLSICFGDLALFKGSEEKENFGSSL